MAATWSLPSTPLLPAKSKSGTIPRRRGLGCERRRFFGSERGSRAIALFPGLVPRRSLLDGSPSVVAWKTDYL